MSKSGETPPGPSKGDIVPLIPTVLRDDPVEIVQSLRESYGDVVRFPYHPGVGSGGYLISHPDDVQYVLQTDHDKFDSHKTNAGADFLYVMGDGLVTSDGDLWMRQTRMISPQFHQNQIADYLQMMGRESLTALDEMRDAETVDILAEMKTLTLRILGQALFSTDIEQEVAPDILDAIAVLRNSFKNRNSTPVSTPRWVPTPHNRRVKRARETLRGAAEELVDRRTGHEDEYDDLLSHMLTVEDDVTGEQMSREQVVDEVVTFIVAGHTTVAAALTWAWYLLAKNPSAQARLHESVLSVDFNDLGFDAITDLAFPRRVAKETFRLYPSVPLIGRETSEQVQLGGYDINTGETIVISPYVTHRDTRFWDCPSVFDPDRFLEHRAGEREEFAYFPFSAGPHTCTGRQFALAETAIVLGAITKHNRLTFANGAVPDVNPDFSVNLQPDSDIRMEVEHWAD